VVLLPGVWGEDGGNKMIPIDIFSFVTGLLLGLFVGASLTAETFRERGFNESYQVGHQLGYHSGKEDAEHARPDN